MDYKCHTYIHCWRVAGLQFIFAAVSLYCTANAGSSFLKFHKFRYYI